MSTESGASPAKFDTLLSAMPSIAESVNKFTSEEAQLLALQGLLDALGLPQGPVATADVTPAEAPAVAGQVQLVQEPDADAAPATPGATSSTVRRRRNGSARGKKSFSPTKNINFAPEGKPSLEEFVGAKSPKNQHERNLVACHYLKEELGMADIGVEDVLAVYLACAWPAPAHPDTSLQNTASARQWLDTSNMKSIQVTWGGRNQITKMPTAAKSA